LFAFWIHYQGLDIKYLHITVYKLGIKVGHFGLIVIIVTLLYHCFFFEEKNHHQNKIFLKKLVQVAYKISAQSEKLFFIVLKGTKYPYLLEEIRMAYLLSY